MPTLDVASVAEISDTLRPLRADVFVLFVKTKSFHWRISGRHCREDHLLLDDHATQIFNMADAIAEPIRKLGRTAPHSIGEIALQWSATTLLPRRSIPVDLTRRRFGHPARVLMALRRMGSGEG